MKRLSKLLLTFFALFLIYYILNFKSNIVYADYPTAYRDFVYNYQLYRDAENQFQVARSSYLTYRTLTSQNDAISKFRTVVQARDQVMNVYYNLLQEKLNSTNGVSDSQKNTFRDIKTSELTWLSNHQQKIQAAASLDDLNSVSLEFESRYPQMDTETKQAIGTVLSAKEMTLRGQLDILIQRLTDKLGEVRSSGEDTSVADRGVINVKSKLDLFSQKYDEAQQVFSGQNSYSQGIILLNGQQKLIEANQYLREAVNYLSEIVKSYTG